MSIATEHLREIHRDLTAAMDQAEEAFQPAVDAAFSDERCPAQDELCAILGVTHRIASRLADFLEGIETAFSEAPDAVLQLLDELEPLRSDDDVEVPPPPAEWYDVDDGMPHDLKEAEWEIIQKIHPCRPKGDSAIGRIPGVYGTSNAIDNQLYEKKIVKNHIWRETHELWAQLPDSSYKGVCESHRTPGLGTFSPCRRKATTERGASTMAMFRPIAELRMHADGGSLPHVSGPHAEVLLFLIAAMQSADGVTVPQLGHLAVVAVAGKKPKLIFHGADELNQRIDSTLTHPPKRGGCGS